MPKLPIDVTIEADSGIPVVTVAGDVDMETHRNSTTASRS